MKTTTFEAAKSAVLRAEKADVLSLHTEPAEDKEHRYTHRPGSRRRAIKTGPSGLIRPGMNHRKILYDHIYV